MEHAPPYRTVAFPGRKPARVGLPHAMRLSVPYNHDLGLLDALRPALEWIASLYVAPHPSLALSARPYHGPETARGALEELRTLARWCAEHTVQLNLVANAPGGLADPTGLRRAALTLRDQGTQVQVTFADLPGAERFRHTADDQATHPIEVGISCLAQVERPLQALWWRERVNATSLTLSREINRRPQEIARLADLGLTLGVVAFDDCVPDCQSRLHHYQRDASGNLTFRGACAAGSAAVRRERPWLLARKEILPAHLWALAPWISVVKVSGRDQPTEEVLRRIALYLEARSLDHPNGWYSEPPEAWDHLATCDGRCHACDWCAEHLRWAPRTTKSSAPTSTRRRVDHDEALWSGRFRGPDGAEVTLTLQPLHPRRPPLRQIGEHGLYYRAQSNQAPNLERLVHHVAGLLERLDAPPDGLADALTERLHETPLPGDYRYDASPEPDKPPAP